MRKLRVLDLFKLSGKSGLDIPDNKNKASNILLFPELFCPKNTLTREKSSIFR